MYQTLTCYVKFLIVLVGRLTACKNVVVFTFSHWFYISLRIQGYIVCLCIVMGYAGKSLPFCFSRNSFSSRSQPCSSCSQPVSSHVNHKTQHQIEHLVFIFIRQRLLVALPAYALKQKMITTQLLGKNLEMSPLL